MFTGLEAYFLIKTQACRRNCAPVFIREYMDICGQVAKARANREKALFAPLFNKAHECGYTATQNPCSPIWNAENLWLHGTKPCAGGYLVAT